MTYPQHIAIVMDGNGRWAELRKRPRSFGHQAGVKAARRAVEACIARDVPCLTLFAFSSENWQRPATEVRRLMDLFLRALEREVDALHNNGVRLRFIGERCAFSPELQQGMARVEERTENNTQLNLNIAANYGGRWDIVQATRKALAEASAGRVEPDSLDEANLAPYFCLAHLPPPDLLIRTGGERRISNFLLWQIAYTELYFSEVLWPDFGLDDIDQALADFASRQRRFGRTGRQVRKAKRA